MRRTIIIIPFILLTCHNLTAQVSKDSDLFRQLKTQDSIFFERAFNQCDMSYLENAIDKNLVFYHDQTGIQDRTKFLETTKKYLCSDTLNKPIRKVDENSLEVFPLYNNNALYGAMQTGNHLFYRRQKGKEDVLTGKAKFIHVYLLVNDKWILKEVISFAHQSAN